MCNKNEESDLVKVNKFMPLLTDVLPYETPLCFDNSNFYLELKKRYDAAIKIYYKKRAQGVDASFQESIEEFFIEQYNPPSIKCMLQKKFYSIPYTYSIRKNQDSTREISLIHPLSQVKICDFWDKYEQLILFNTNKSSISLRHPFKNTKMIHKKFSKIKRKLLKSEDDSKSVNINEIENIDKSQTKNQDIFLNNYFIYKKFDMLYKFFESSLMLKNEKKYKFLTWFDVSRCFNSIYTHSIEWAVKNKDFAKNNLNIKENKTFEKNFDRIMQFSNFQETHGIAIGSEASRIFAEIIFQDIDFHIMKDLEEKKLKNKCKIYRYIDDFFIFYNEEEIFEQVKHSIEQNLKQYCLYLNPAKIETLKRPFISNKTIARKKGAEIINNYLANVIEIIDEKVVFHLPKNKFYMNNINDLRHVIKEYLDNSGEITSYCLGIIKNRLTCVLAYLKKDEIKNQDKNYLYFVKKVLFIVFYLYGLSQKTNSTVGVCKICYLIIQTAIISKNKSIIDEVKNTIVKYIYEYIENVEISNDTIEIEQLDILLLLKECEKNKLPENKIEKLFDLENLSYFYIVVLLDYIQNKKYKRITKEIEDFVLKEFKKTDPLKYTQNYLLLIDLIKCPYTDLSFCENLLKNIGINNQNSIQRTIKEIKAMGGFYNWDCKMTTNKILTLKELHNKYN